MENNKTPENMEELMTMMVGINKFFYYANNFSLKNTHYQTLFDGVKSEYLPNFIDECNWNCNTAHMVDKWKGVVSRCNKPSNYLMEFYAELDNTNRRELLDWICTNYSGECKLF